MINNEVKRRRISKKKKGVGRPKKTGIRFANVKKIKKWRMSIVSVDDMIEQKEIG